MNYRAVNIKPRPSTRPITPYNQNFDSKINPLFGLTLVKNFKTDGTKEALDALYEDFVPRETGILKTIDLQNQIADSLSNPAAYLLEKNKDLEKIGKELANVYKKAFGKVYNKGKTLEEAKKYALNYTKTFEKIKLEKHAQDFPPELVQDAVDKLRIRNSQGGLVF